MSPDLDNSTRTRLEEDPLRAIFFHKEGVSPIAMDFLKAVPKIAACVSEAPRIWDEWRPKMLSPGEHCVADRHSTNLRWLVMDFLRAARGVQPSDWQQAISWAKNLFPACENPALTVQVVLLAYVMQKSGGAADSTKQTIWENFMM